MPGSRTVLWVLAAGLLAAGCSPKKPGERAPAEPVQRPAWDWDAFPAASRMRIGILPCQIQPRSSMTVLSPLLGILRVYVTSPQANLPAGFLWAEFEPEIFAAEEKSLEEARRKLEDLEKLQWEIEFPRKKLQLEEQLEEARRQVDYLRLLSTNALIRERIFKMPDHSSPIRADSLLKSESKLQLIEQNLEYLRSTNFAALGFDLASQRTEWERRKLDFQRRQAQSRFFMPFDGKLTVSVPITPGVTNYHVNLNQELGIVRDTSSIRARVVIENVSWTALATDRLKAMIRAGPEQLEARFSFQKIERVQNREEAAYYFEFPPERSARAARLLGANVACELWVDLDESARIVPKLAIVLHRPDAFQSRDWATAVGAVFPGARLVLEGQTDLAVIPPPGIRLSSAR